MRKKFKNLELKKLKFRHRVKYKSISKTKKDIQLKVKMIRKKKSKKLSQKVKGSSYKVKMFGLESQIFKINTQNYEEKVRILT